MKKYDRLTSNESAELKWILPFSTSEVFVTITLVILWLGLSLFGAHWLVNSHSDFGAYDTDAVTWYGETGKTLILFVIFFIIGYRLFPFYSQPSGWQVGKWLNHFIHANVFGFERWYGINIHNGKLETIDSPPYNQKTENDVNYWLVVPWGGWFRKAKIRSSMGFSTIKVSAKHGSLVVKLTDAESHAITLPIEYVLQLMPGIDDLYHMKPRIDELLNCEKNVAILSATIDKAILDIIETQRFIKSTEAWDIANELLRIMQNYNPLAKKYAEFKMPPRPKERHKKKGTAVPTTISKS